MRRGDHIVHQYDGRREDAAVLSDVCTWMGGKCHVYILGSGKRQLADMCAIPSARKLQKASRLEPIDCHDLFLHGDEVRARESVSRMSSMALACRKEGQGDAVFVLNHDWLAEDARLFKDFSQVEMELNLHSETPLTVVCQYDASKFTEDQLAFVSSMHPKSLTHGILIRNFWLVPRSIQSEEESIAEAPERSIRLGARIKP